MRRVDDSPALAATDTARLSDSGVAHMGSLARVAFLVVGLVESSRWLSLLRRPVEAISGAAEQTVEAFADAAVKA